MMVRSLIFIASIVAVGSGGFADDWHQFRGPSGDGRVEAAALPTTWGGFLEPPAWKTPLPGIGWSSPIVVGDRIWLTAAEETVLDEAERDKKLEKHPYGRDEFQTHAAVRLLAIELDVATGKILRRLHLADAQDPTPIHLVNSYASPTPISDGKILICDFGSLGTFCVEIATGKQLWSRQLIVDDITGPASSPVMTDNGVIIVRDGCDDQSLTSLDRTTGETLWQTKRPPMQATEPKHRRAFVTPLLVDTPSGKQLLAPTAEWVASYDPTSGEEIWRASIPVGHALVPRPVYGEGIVYVCSGYPRPSLVAISTDGQGDVTETHVRWTYDRQVPLLASPLLDGKEIYFVSTTGIATCLDTATGRPIWQERLSGNFTASPILADGKLYFTNRKGTTTVVRPGREFTRLARNKLFGYTMASIAVAEGALIVRTAEALFCIRKSKFDGLKRD